MELNVGEKACNWNTKLVKLWKIKYSAEGNSENDCLRLLL